MIQKPVLSYQIRSDIANSNDIMIHLFTFHALSEAHIYVQSYKPLVLIRSLVPHVDSRSPNSQS